MTESNPYQAPPSVALPEIGNTASVIDGLPVSERWKKKFRLIEKAGGEKLPRFKELTFKQRFALNFNIWALLFGPVYMLIKGMWKLAVSTLLITLVVAFVVGLIELALQKNFGNGLFIGLSAAFSMLANRNYYKKMVLGRLDWF
ncbi:DUF2628 domain-containing protein [Snodgrassella sp. CFCC 13594]|uniref:DUF2628 domain-containing protein n=1 Tax=Snodgrassella sp. CFCC 13594 TaxID=1775559 RepID=UPI0008368A98|nr:DUF2628 domain-containing protein [Snodgrassella sp. CFCC 13594]